jgi:hypothetical protein
MEKYSPFIYTIYKKDKKSYVKGKRDMKNEILKIIKKYSNRTNMQVFDELYEEVYNGYNAWYKKYYGKKVK